jgi:transcriptional regulator with XRE-family HTH domain
MDISKIIKKLRSQRGWSQQNLADDMEIHISTIQRWEKDASKISYTELQKLATIFNLTVPDLLSYTDQLQSMVKEPAAPGYTKQKRVTISIELDGEGATLDYWFGVLKRMNAAL